MHVDLIKQLNDAAERLDLLLGLQVSEVQQTAELRSLAERIRRQAQQSALVEETRRSVCRTASSGRPL